MIRCYYKLIVEVYSATTPTKATQGSCVGIDAEKSVTMIVIILNFYGKKFLT